MIKLHLKAVDFKDTKFIGFKDGCAIEKAAMRQFKLLKSSLFENTQTLQIFHGQKKSLFKHDSYFDTDFNLDLRKSKELNFDNTIIRTIELNFPS